MIVDDEEMVTISLRNLFQLQSDYRIITHTSAREALSAAESHPVDLVISDYLMPEWTESRFLSKLKEKQTQAVRVLLTGYATRRTRSGDQLRGPVSIRRKAMDNDELLVVVKNGLEKRALLRTLEQKLAELDQAHSSLKSFQTELIKAFM